MQKHKKLSTRLVSLILTVAMVFTTLPQAVFAGEGDVPQTPSGTRTTERTITAFDELGEGFSKSAPFDGHTYVLGVQLNTPFEEVGLPTALGVTVETTTATETAQEKVPVTWKGDSEYNPAENSKTAYTAVLPEGYTLADSAKLPTINVMVGMQARAALPRAMTGAGTELDPYIPATWTELSDSVARADNSPKQTFYYKLNCDLTCEKTSPIVLDAGGKAVIDLNGCTLDRGLGSEPEAPRKQQGNAITVRGDLTVRDTSVSQTGKITGGYNGSDGGGVTVEYESGKPVFTLESGTISGNKSARGGGIYAENRTTINLYGGVITDNVATTVRNATNPQWAEGGGIYVEKAAINIGGSPQVRGNRGDSRSNMSENGENNLYLGGISGGGIAFNTSKPIDGTAKIGLSGPSLRQMSDSTVTEEEYTKCAAFFFADQTKKSVPKNYKIVHWQNPSGFPSDFADMNNTLVLVNCMTYAFDGQYQQGAMVPFNDAGTAYRFDLIPVYLDFTPTAYSFRWLDETLESEVPSPCASATLGTVTNGLAELTLVSKAGVDVGTYYLEVTATNGSQACTNPALQYVIEPSEAPVNYPRALDVSVPSIGGSATFSLPIPDKGTYGAITDRGGAISLQSSSSNLAEKTITVTVSAASDLTERGEIAVEIDNSANNYKDYNVICTLIPTAGPTIAVAAQSGTATYGTVASPTFAVTNSSFGGKYPSFAPSIAWTGGKAPAGVTTAFTDSDAKLTVSTSTATPAGEYKFRVVSAKPAGETGNYESAEATLKVDKLEATIAWTGDSFPYNGSVQAPTATVSNAVNGDVVTVTVTGGKTNVGNTYTATASGFGGAAKDNYKLQTPAPTQVFAITKAAYTGTQTVAPDKAPKSKTHDTITLNDVTPPAGEAVEYGITKPDGTTTWQDNPTFTTLSPDTEYKFYTRVKANNNHDAGDTSPETKIKTDMTDNQKVLAAKTAVENALNNYTATNATDNNMIIALVEKALTDAGITDVTQSWNTSFVKNSSTENAAGSITGKILLTCNGTTTLLELNKTIAQLPSDPVEKVRLVKAAIEAALNAYTATNSTTANNIKAIVDKANADSGVSGVTVTWKTPSDFNNKNSTNAENGKVTGTFDLKCTSGGSTKTDTVSFDRPIERSDAQKLADAKAKVEAALNKFIATNTTTDADVRAVLTNALSGTGATAAWKSPSDFSKTLADESKAGKITGTIVVTFNGSTSDVNVDLTIARLVADKTGLTNAIADATNAKNGIVSNNASSPSAVASGTKYVSDAEMKALTDAIAVAQAVANNATATTAEVTAAANTLQAAVNTFKAVIKTGTYRSSGGDDGSTGGPSSSSTNTTTPPTVVTQDPMKLAPPTTVETTLSATVENNGHASVTVSDQIMQSAIAKAVSEGMKNGTSENGVAVVINVSTGGNDVNTVTVNLPKTVQEQVMAGQVLNTMLVLDRPDIAINMNLASIREINRQAQSDVQLSATRMDSTKLSDEARRVIGGRPAYDLNATYANGSKSVRSFGNGSVTLEIPYTLQNGEWASGLYTVYVDENGEPSRVTNSSYDADAQVMRSTTNHWSVYGIAYKAPIGFTDIANHWAKTDIEFVVNRGLFSGTSSTTFSPNEAMTRGMFVTVLSRLANADVGSYKASSFSDVKADAYYLGAIEWASKNGIVKGIGEGKFAPDQPITREQMAAIIESYAEAIGYILPNVHAENTFADSAKIGDWAKDSVKKAQMADILSGKSGNVFDPQGTATRAEASAVLHRFIELAITTD